MIRKATTSALLFAALLSTAAPAEEPAREVGGLPDLVMVSATIGYSDVDLRTPQGETELRRRVAVAAREMCRPNAVPGQPRGRLDGHCYRQAMANARTLIDRVVALQAGTVQTALNRAPRQVPED